MAIFLVLSKLLFQLLKDKYSCLAGSEIIYSENKYFGFYDIVAFNKHEHISHLPENVYQILKDKKANKIFRYKNDKAKEMNCFIAFLNLFLKDLAWLSIRLQEMFSECLTIVHIYFVLFCIEFIFKSWKDGMCNFFLPVQSI